MSELISQLTHFDDNLKLKLHLNLELNQQDQKIWNKHAALLQGGGSNNASTQIIDQTDSFDHLLSVLHKVIGNLQSKACYRPDQFDPSMHQEDQKRQINKDLRQVVDALRSLM